MSSDKLVTVDFEVYGEVQGVFFRKFTAEAAKSRGCVGWVENTHKGTVRGVIQGKQADVEYMKNWLEKTGSPMSRIQEARFTNETSISAPQFHNFQIRH